MTYCRAIAAYSARASAASGASANARQSSALRPKLVLCGHGRTHNDRRRHSIASSGCPSARRANPASVLPCSGTTLRLGSQRVKANALEGRPETYGIEAERPGERANDDQGEANGEPGQESPRRACVLLSWKVRRGLLPKVRPLPASKARELVRDLLSRRRLRHDSSSPNIQPQLEREAPADAWPLLDLSRVQTGYMGSTSDGPLCRVLVANPDQAAFTDV
jgi:hypothetical protein